MKRFFLLIALAFMSFSTSESPESEVPMFASEYFIELANAEGPCPQHCKLPNGECDWENCN